MNQKHVYMIRIKLIKGTFFEGVFESLNDAVRRANDIAMKRNEERPEKLLQQINNKGQWDSGYESVFVHTFSLIPPKKRSTIKK